MKVRPCIRRSECGAELRPRIPRSPRPACRKIRLSRLNIRDDRKQQMSNNPRRAGVRDLLWIQGISDQGVFRELLPAHGGRHIRDLLQSDGRASELGRVMEGHRSRHGCRHHDRWAVAASSKVFGRTALLYDVRRRRRQCRPVQAPAVSRSARAMCNRDRGSAAGALRSPEFHGYYVIRFVEKPRGDGRWINGGIFVLEPQVFEYLYGDDDVREQEPLRRLADDGQLVAYRHDGFWAAMDTLRDKPISRSYGRPAGLHGSRVAKPNTCSVA
jgi:hypothetical protein